MRASRNEPHNDIDLAALPAVLKRSAKTLVIASMAVGLLTYGGLSLVPSRYTSEAQIGIGAKGRGSNGTIEMAALQVDKEAIASRVQELRSPDLARRLASEMKLSLRPEFNSAIDNKGLFAGLMRMTGINAPRPGETEEERVLAAYYKALQVYQVKETRVITLSFTARDGNLAANAANRLIELYQEWLRQQGVTETTDANAWLAPEIQKRTRELAQSEAAVERFRTSANLFRGGGSQPSGLAEQQLTDLAAELTKARGQRSEAEARARSARELMGRGSPDAIPDVQKSPVIQGLIAQRVRAERDMAEASSQLLPAHPRMRQLAANVADVRRHVQREAAIIVEGLEREAKVLGLREELALRALDEAKGRVGDKAGDRVRLAQLEDEATAKRRELAVLRDRYESARSRGTTKAGPIEVQVIATARPSSKPSWPNRIQISALAAAATLVLGLVLVLFKELLSSGNRTAGGRREAHVAGDELDGPSYAPGQGVVARAPAAGPEYPAPAARPASGPVMPLAAKVAHEAKPAARAASVAATVMRLIGNSAGQGGYRTVVVGESDDIDVREEAVDIAAGLSAAGRQVVLVDWAPSGDGISRRLGVPSSPGFSDLLAGTHLFEDIIRILPDGDVHVVPCGSARPQGGKGLEADKLNLLLDALDEAYGDVVVTGSFSAIRELFLAIEGRFDAGIVVGRPGSGRGAGDTPNRLLGFDVTDIDVLRIEQSAPTIAARLAKRRPATPAATGEALSTAS